MEIAVEAMKKKIPVKPKGEWRMSDLISRQDAIKEVSKYVHSVDMIIGNGTLSMAGCIDVAEEILEGLPSMESEPKWIPCSERMPEPRVDVWCYSDMGEMVGYYEEHIDAWYGRDYLELIVTAWMPLPIPYCGGNEE